MTGSFEWERVGVLDVSAASGIVSIGDALFVIADDEGALFRFDRTGRRIGTLDLGLPPLPAAHALRKRSKPDFESLVDLGDGRVALLGSGSTGARHRGKVVDLERAIVGEVDLEPLHRALGATFPELNLEGAVVRGDEFVLAQRGNGASRSNALVVLDLATVREGLANGRIDATALRSVVSIDLGARDGVPLSITDLAVDRRGRLWCATAAEDTTDTYEDGACRGSALCRFDEGHAIDLAVEVPGRAKIEGMSFDSEVENEGFLVDDPDDRNLRATLLRFRIR